MFWTPIFREQEMNFTQLRAFHAVATTRGFTKAAEFLNVTRVWRRLELDCHGLL